FVFPWAEDSYLIPKFTLLNFGIILILYSLFFQGKLYRKPVPGQVQELEFSPRVRGGLRIRPSAYCLLIYLLLNALSLIYATSIPLALKETGKWFFLILFYFAVINVIRKEKQLRLVINTLLFAGFITALWTILQDYHISLFKVLPRLPDWRGSLVAGLGNSDYVAGFLVSIFPLGFVQYAIATETRYKIFLLIALSLIYAALIIAFSVGANTGLILGMILVLGLMIRYRPECFRENKMKWLGLFVCFVIITAFYVLPIPFNGRGQSIFSQAFASNRWKEGGNTRLVIWANTWELIKSQPILGTGSGNFTYRYLDYISPKVIENPKMRLYAGEYTNAAHNEFLHTWSELGILGVILLLFLIGSFFFSAKRMLSENSAFRIPPFDFAQDKQSEMGKACPETSGTMLCSYLLGATGGFTAMLIYGIMSYPLHLPATAMLFIFYLALPSILINIRTVENKVQKSSSLSTVYRLLLTVCFLFLALWTLRPLIADTYFRFGKTALKRNDAPSALHAFTLATRWDNHADAHYHLGELYLRSPQLGSADKERLAAAIAEFELARKQRNDKYLLYELGIVYIFAERFPNALTCFKPLTQRQPDNPDYWDRLSFVYLKLGNLQLSHEAHLKAEQLRNNF
ncbi:MAG: O-antigen ligase family protein, partial [bacterium]|nr:O-antigen ligase family protein [bacterium]